MPHSESYEKKVILLIVTHALLFERWLCSYPSPSPRGAHSSEGPSLLRGPFARQSSKAAFLLSSKTLSLGYSARQGWGPLFWQHYKERLKVPQKVK